jgi:hypothetical protein
MRRKALFLVIAITLTISAAIQSGWKAEAADPASAFRHADWPQSPQIKPAPRPELTLRWLSSVTLNKTTTIGGAVDGDIIGTIRLLRPALDGGLAVNLSLDGPPTDVEAGIPVSLESSSVTVPSGKASANFRIRTSTHSGYSYPLQCTVRARYGDETKTASFTIEELRIASIGVLPPAGGFGPFTATGTGTVALNARPASSRTVRLTSSHPDVVRFGTIGNTQSSRTLTFNSSSPNPQGFQVVAGSVSQNTTVTISATMNGRTVTSQLTVRAQP